MASNRRSSTSPRAVSAPERSRPPATITPGSVTPLSANPIVEWLLREGWSEHDLRAFVGRFGDYLAERGLPVMRLRITGSALHPQVIGVSYTWERGKPEVVEFEPPWSILESAEFLRSPYAALREGAGAIRRRLDIPDVALEYPVLEDLKAEGASDYVADAVEAINRAVGEIYGQFAQDVSRI
ncbi:MAG: hypothetical protein EXQ90_07890 [Rhodospirillales bacterium]|nr:hypothetical protein [Rhodospirillales bacterium]